MNHILSDEQRQEAGAAADALLHNHRDVLTYIERRYQEPDTRENAQLKDIMARVKRLRRKAEGVFDNPLLERSALYRAIHCLALAGGNALQAQKYAEQHQLDATTSLIIRAATTGAGTGVTAWAGELVQAALGEFIPLLRARSALFALAPNQIPIDGSVVYPRMTAGSSSGFVAEGAAIPVKQNTLGNVTLVLYKAAGIVVGTSQLMQRADQFSESFFVGTLADDLALGVDAVFLSNSASSTAAPAGIFHSSNGATGITATAGGTAAACAVDLSALLAAGAKFASPKLVINPAAVAAALALSGASNYPIITGLSAGRIGRVEVIETGNITLDTIALIDADGLLVAGGAGLQIDVSTDATLYMEDAPAFDDFLLPVTQGASMFQRDMVATAVKLPITWRSKRTEQVQHVASATWC